MAAVFVATFQYDHASLTVPSGKTAGKGSGTGKPRGFKQRQFRLDPSVTGSRLRRAG
jgi:hypothetical protein